MTMLVAFVVCGVLPSVAVAPRGITSVMRAELARQRKAAARDAAQALADRRREPRIWADTDAHLFEPPPVAPDVQEMGW